MLIAIATDAWFPQRNGVVRVLDSLRRELLRAGHQIRVVAPDEFLTVPLPGYPEIPLSVLPGRKMRRLLDGLAPDAIHIATEGPIGRAARAYCLRRGLPFTTAYHSKFPEYIHARLGLPLGWLYGTMRRFHAPASAVLVPSDSVRRELAARGFANLVHWSHGVDDEAFRPRGKDYVDLPRPLHLYVGRVTVDKNLPAFLDLDLPGSKLVVGDGPGRAGLMRRYPQVHFRIANGDLELSRYYSAADVFVFPSRTDTFGLVILEALACGTPVAAFPVTGPRDVIGESGAGCLDEDLGRAIRGAMGIDPARCRGHAQRFSWRAVAAEFLAALAPIRRGGAPAGELRTAG